MNDPTTTHGLIDDLREALGIPERATPIERETHVRTTRILNYLRTQPRGATAIAVREALSDREASGRLSVMHRRGMVVRDESTNPFVYRAAEVA